MTLQNMRYIVAVAQYRSVSRAAAALYMTQSALSAAVKDAEEELGIQIFVRTNRGVTLTSDGEDSCATARRFWSAPTASPPDTRTATRRT